MLRRKILLFILLSCISTLSFAGYAQKSTARISVNPIEIAIGQQAEIDLEVIAPKGHNIILPVYNDTLISGIEVLAMLKADTAYAHEVMTITQKYIVTSFDSTLYHIPYVSVIDGTDTIRTNDFALKVTSPDLSEATLAYLKQYNEQPTDSIDFNQLGITDIKPVQKPPFVWQDYLAYILIPLLIILLLAAIGVGVYLYLRKKKKGYFFTPVIVEPPHVIALHALDNVKGEKLWQQGREKEYYTDLTDILREYLKGRFHINALEMTSDEILSAINNFTESESTHLSLEQVLRVADLVKFAKYKPFPDENDLSLVNAYLFVNQTKREEPVVTGDESQNENASNPESGVSEDDPIDWSLSERKKTDN